MVNITLPNPGDSGWGTTLNAAINAINAGKEEKSKVNAKSDFGCKGDGVTDDTVAFQAFVTALGQGGSNAGQQGYIPPGTYIISSAIVGHSLTRITGGGKYVTTIKQTANNQDVLQFIGSSGTNYLGIELSDMTIQGPGQSSGSTGVGLNLNWWLDTCYLKRMIIQQNGSHGVSLQNSYMVSFEHIWHYQNGGDGLNALTSINSVKWDNCEFFGNTGNGATIDGAAGAILMACDWETNGKHGLKLNHCYAVTVEASDFENNGTSSPGTTYAALYCDATSGYAGPRIVGCNFTGTSGMTANGIELTTNVTSAYVEGCSFNNFALNDILIDSGAAGVVIAPNNVNQAGTPVIVTDNALQTTYLGKSDLYYNNADGGWKAASFDWLNMPNMSALSGMSNYAQGVPFGVILKVRRPITVSSFHFYWVQPTGGSPANCYVGLLDSNGNLIDKTADLTSTASGLRTPAMAGGSHTLQPGDYYAVLLIGTQGTTQGGIAYPTSTLITGLGVGQGYGGLSANKYRAAKIGNLTGQTALTGPYTLANNVGSIPLFGISIF